MNEDRWLSKQEYSRLRYRAKKLGVKELKLNQLWHLARFDYVTVAFMFRPLQCHASIHQAHPLCGHFTDASDANKIKGDIDKATVFMDFLKEFENSTL